MPLKVFLLSILPGLVEFLGGKIDKVKKLRNYDAFLIEIPTRKIDALYQALRSYGRIKIPAFPKKQADSPMVRIWLRFIRLE